MMYKSDLFSIIFLGHNLKVIYTLLPLSFFLLVITTINHGMTHLYSIQYILCIFLGNVFTTSLKAPNMWQIMILSASKSESRLPQPKGKHFPFITLYKFFLSRCIFMLACFNTKKHDCEDYQPSAVFLCTKCKESYDTVTLSQ